MVKDFFESIKVDVRDKSRNPFIGAFILVWTIRNREAVYIFFSFDAGLTREEKIKILNDYFVDYGFWEVLATVLISLGAIVLSYLLLNITRGIVNAYEKMLTPQVLKWTGYNDVVPLQVFELELNIKLERKIKDLKTELSEEKLEKEELEKRLLTSTAAEEKGNNFGKRLQDVAATQANFSSKRRNEVLAQEIVERMTDTDLSTFLKVANI